MEPTIYGEGEVIGGKYRVVRVLGRGATGWTYEATTEDGTQVAVKVLVLRGLSEWKTFDLFEREARVLQHLAHPAIPRYVDDLQEEGPDGPRFCLVQQLAPGRTLQALVEGGWRGSEADVRGIAERMLDVLVYLHGRHPPVIHRDLKPLNVLRDDSGAIYVVDFGAVRDCYQTTVMGGSTMVGTYGYMAPEQMRGQARPATDLYGLGATLVFLLTGKSPADLPSRRLMVDFRSHARVSPAFAAWLDRMLAPAEEDRFASAEAALQALRSGRLPAPATAASPPRRSAGVAAAAVFVAVAGFGVGAFVLLAGGSEPAVVVAESSPPEPVPAPPAPKPQGAEESSWWPNPTHPSMSGPLDVLWATEIGLTTYRSTIHVYDGKIVVNSNGRSRSSHADLLDGVYVLNPDGTTVMHIFPPGEGEKDSNGVALAETGLYFGTDQDVVYHYDWSGNLVWQRQIDGDAEAPPALSDFNGDGTPDVAVSSEAGTFYLLDGKDGSIRGSVQAGRGEYGQTGFAGPPALFDANDDGVDDVFVPARDQVFRAIDGKTGEVLWTYRGGSGMHSAPIIVDVNNDGEQEVVFTEAYSGVYAANARNGQILWSTDLSHPGGGIEGLFGSVGWLAGVDCVLVETAWWGEQEGVYCIDSRTGKVKWRHTEGRDKISSGTVVADVDGDAKAEVIFGTESGSVVAVDQTGKEVFRQSVGGPVECSPTVADLDGDGQTDILVASGDGKLYAFSTKGRWSEAKLAYTYYRGDPANTGRFPMF